MTCASSAVLRNGGPSVVNENGQRVYPVYAREPGVVP